MNDYPIFYSYIESGCLTNLQQSLKIFVKQPFDYKQQYLQSNYNIGFDGYSYMGQKDSSHQAASDWLHSFVLSSLQDKNVFPKEFWPFLQNDFARVIAYIQNIERGELQRLQLFELAEIYDDLFGHMVSCNYYPAIAAIDDSHFLNCSLRLERHKDVSLFTTFPLGVAAGLSIGDTVYGSLDQTMLFPGYFLEWYTQGKITALYHKVALPQQQNTERFGFSFFSIPKPGKSFSRKGQSYTSDDYYKNRPPLV